MDAIDLMAIKPWQIREALGKDRIKVIRGSRQVYNSRKSRSKKCDVANYEAEDDGNTFETSPIWTCTDLACGGVIKRKFKKAKPIMADNMSQTDNNDMNHYWDPIEVLNRHNVTILTGKPRDIQQSTGRRMERKGSNISISQRGTMTSVGTSCCGKLISCVFGSVAPLGEEDTSDSSEEEMPQNEPKERDHEWLEHTESELSRDDMQAAYEADLLMNPPPPLRIEIRCHNLISSITPFLWVLKLGGRWPLETHIEDRLVKFRQNRWSFSYIIFVLTTLILILCTSQASMSAVRLLTSANYTHSYEQQREKVLFNKYWPYLFVTILYTVYASIWSLASIFDDGRFLADFMTRWNFAVSTVNYDPSSGVRTEMWVSLGWLIFYFATLTIFYIWDMIPAVRGTSELLGQFMLGPFISEHNRIKYHGILSLVGFVFHLYAAFSARVTTLLVLLYCKFLENIARRWNLRFCYVTGILGRFEEPNKYIIYHTVIPFTKLFMEHKLILSLSRYTGKVFSVALLTYFLSKGLESLLLCYRTACLVMFVEAVEEYPEPFLKCPPKFENCVPVKFKDENVHVVMTLLYLTCQSISGWYMTTESISSCGAVIMSGFNFVRRYGFPRCKNSKERRFIQSLNFAFAPVSNFYIYCGFTINRNFSYEMFAWVFAFTTMLIAFSPFQLDTENMTFCTQDQNGSISCYGTALNRIARLKTIEDIVEKTSKMKDPPFGSPPSSGEFKVFHKHIQDVVENIEAGLVPELKIPTPVPDTTPSPSTTPTPATEPPSTVPPGSSNCIPSDMNIPPYLRCNIQPRGDPVYVPVGCYKDGTLIEPYKLILHAHANPTQCFSTKSHEPFKPYEHIGDKEKIYYCDGGCGINQSHTTEMNRDECGNLPFSSSGILPHLKVVTVGTKKTGTGLLCCCYDYEWYSTLIHPHNNVLHNNCGIRNEDQLKSNCKSCTPATSSTPRTQADCDRMSITG